MFIDASWTNPLTKDKLENVLGFHVLHWPGSYVTAFTHKSAVGYPGASTESFEKLEFLGDAVLGFIVGRYLYESYKDSPNINEGFLTQLRTKLVSGKALAVIAQRMNLHSLIIMSPKAMRSNFNTNPRILEDVLESLIGAVFEDQGMVAARQFVLNIIHTHVDTDMLRNKNYKDKLMQWCQQHSEPLPEYISTTLPDGGFSVVAHACGRSGTGQGSTKREAEQNAAQECLKAFEV